MFTLPIKRGWLLKIVTGEKKEEYREIKPYYTSRLEKHIGKSVIVRLRNGYSRTSPYVVVNVTISKKTGRPEWGAMPDKVYYVLAINDILKRVGV